MDPDFYQLQHRRLTPSTAADDGVVTLSLRPLVEEEVMRVMKVSGGMTPMTMHRAVRQEVFQLFEDKTLVEALIGHRLREEMRGEFLQDQYRQHTPESMDRLKAHHLKVFDGKAKEVLAELRQENTRFAEGMWIRLDRLEKELEMTLVPRLEGLERHALRHNSLPSEVNALHDNIQEMRREFRVELAAHGREQLESRSKAEEETQKEFRLHLLAQDQKSFESRFKSEEDFRVHVGSHSDDLRNIVAKTNQAVWEQNKRLEFFGQLGEERHIAVEASMQELQEQIHGLRDWTAATEARQDQGHESIRQELRHELDHKISTTASTPEMDELRSKVVRSDETIGAVEQRLWEALQEHTAQIGRRLDLSQEQADRRHCDYASVVEKRESAAEVRLREAMEAQQRLGEEPVVGIERLERQLQAKEKQQAEESRVQTQELHAAVTDLQSRLGSENDEMRAKAEMLDAQRLELKETLEDLQSRFWTHAGELQAIAAKKDEAIPAVEQRFLEVRQEHVAAMARLEQELELKVEQHMMDNQMLQAMNKSLEAKLLEVGEAPQAVSRECAHRLHAVAYSLLEVIGEVELTGSISEAREKRMKLHQHLCDRLGAIRPKTPRTRRISVSDSPGPKIVEASEAQGALTNGETMANASLPALALQTSSRPTSCRGGRNSGRAQHVDMDDLARNLEAKSIEMRASMRNSMTPTPRSMSTKKHLHNLRDVRTMRLMDYSSFDDQSSVSRVESRVDNHSRPARPSTSIGYFDGRM